MKKVMIFLFILTISFNLLSIDVFANPTKTTNQPTPIKVKLNDKYLSFDVDPIIENGRTLVPMRAIFEYLGSKVDWYPETQTVIGYRDNMFIKLQIGNKTVYKNGKGYKIEAAPIIKDGRTLVPIRFISQSFGLVVDWDDENRTVLLNYDNDLGLFKDFDNVTYKSVSLDQYGLKFMVPYYWDHSEESQYIFSHEDEENNIKMKVDILELEEEKTLDEFAEGRKIEILESFKDRNIVIVGKDEKEVKNLKINKVQLKDSSVEPEFNQILYFIATSDYGYTISFTYHSEGNDSQLANIFSNITDTIEIGSLTVDLTDEHYIEYDQYFINEFNIESEIYSNMDVRNKFKFKGSVSKSSNLEYLFVSVSKDDESMEFKIPIKDKKFDADIYTPFGLGKHNIVIGTPLNEDNTSKYIMQFSVINTNNDYLRYLIPSRFIENTDKEIISLSKEVTKDHYTDYKKTQQLFKWVVENIEYDTIANTDNSPRSAKEVLKDKTGDCDEISYLYAALARSIDIPAKVISGKMDEDEYHVWNEIQVNGKWIVVDPTWGAGYVDSSDDDSTYIKELDMSYFNKNREYYEKQFTDIKVLPY